MANFDFHSTLNPKQFEQLIRDILEIKFKGTSFRTYAPGKDGGIDVKSIDGDVKIICQTKLYQNRFHQLYTSLKRDVKKLVKHQASQYIIATSCILTDKNIQEIRTLFALHNIQLQQTDIWDREMLNQMLKKNEYTPVLSAHINLFLTDITVLETSLRNVINNNLLERSIDELEKIKRESKYFVETKAARVALERLVKEKVVVLTGTAGSGKTTTAKILINGLLNILESPIEFIKLRKIEEGEHIIRRKKRQIFLFDDYWGQFTEEVHEHHAANRSALPEFIERISRLEQHYLIITSRDYIIENESIQKQSWLKMLIDKHRFVIRLGTFNLQERAHLFIRHLHYSNYSPDYFTTLFHGNTIDEIVNHPNYNPRLVCDFIDFQFDKIKRKNPHTNVNDFYRHLQKHLDKPQLFWHDLIKSKNDAGRLLLFILVISSSNNTEQEIRATFNKCVEICQGKGIQVSIKDFKEAMRLLEDGFIELLPLSSGIFSFRFRNGSIADAVITYLQKESPEWLPILLQGALFFNQLTQNFTTYSNGVGPDKIILKDKDKSILIDRLLKEFLTLYDHANDLVKSNFSSNQYVYRLYQMPFVFNLAVDINIRDFLIEQAETIKKAIVSNPHFFSRRDFYFLPYFCLNIKQWYQVNDPVFLVNIFLNINHFKDYEHFIKLQGAYPEPFKQFLLDNSDKINDHIKQVIVANAKLRNERDNNLMTEAVYKKIVEVLQIKHSKSLESALWKLGVQYDNHSTQNHLSDEFYHKEEPDNDALKNSNDEHNLYTDLLKQYVGSFDNKIEDKFPAKSQAAMAKYHKRILDEICLSSPAVNRNDVGAFLCAMAIDCYDSVEWYTEHKLQQHWKERIGKDFPEQLDLTPAFLQSEKWFRLSKGYARYLVELYGKKDVVDAAYYDAMTRTLEKTDFQDLDDLTLLYQSDPERFSTVLMTPHIKAFLKDIDLTDEKSITFSCCNKAEWETQFSVLKEKGKYVKMEYDGGGHNIPHAIEVLTALLGIEEYFNFFSDYLIIMINDLKSKDPQFFNDFATYLDQRSLIEDKDRQEVEDDEWFGYNMKISEEIKNPAFYAMAERCGWVAKLSNIIRSLYQIAQN